MIIVKIIGGLGNQMFQYAYARALKEKGYDVKIDVSAFETYTLHGGYQLDKYDIGLSISSAEENSKFYKNKTINKILKYFGFRDLNIIQENSLLFDKNLLNIENSKYISGYFQTELYFKNIRNRLLCEFVFTGQYAIYTEKMAKNILNQAGSCSIHVRRGDFINNVNKAIHGVCDLHYYLQAIKLMNSISFDLTYFIFSDDIEWAKKNFKISNVFYIDSLEMRAPHEDIYLMSLCQNNIIANSSFSWWGAWLNKNDEKIIIAPNRWFADDTLEEQSKNIVCDSWLKI